MLKASFQSNSTLTANFSNASSLSAAMSATVVIPIQHDYTGDYVITPSAEEQTLQTEDLHMLHNVRIGAIPNNYGLITWNGTTLTVS